MIHPASDGGDPTELAAIRLQAQQQTVTVLKSLILDQQGAVGHRLSQ